MEGRRRRGRLCRGQGGGRLAELAGERIADVEDAGGHLIGERTRGGGTFSRGQAKYFSIWQLHFRAAGLLEEDLGDRIDKYLYRKK